MGYRTRLGRIAKKEREKYIGKSLEQLQSEFTDFWPCRPLGHEELYEIGKYAHWKWSASTGINYKKDWPEFERIAHLKAQCACCHYFF